MSNVPIPDPIDEMAMLRVMAHVLSQPTFAVACYSFRVSITVEGQDEYCTEQGFRRIMGRVSERDAAILILRYGLDGGGKRTYREIAARLDPPTSPSYANQLGQYVFGALRRAICEELREKQRGF